MSDIAIRAEGLGKRYRLGSRERYRTLRDAITVTLTAPFRRRGRESSKDAEETFWALKDISFEVKHGEVIGIIGRNGAGKSTLLKILSRITEPSEGQAQMYGRVASLLEVGTGFHPELSGRDNIYLNGAILGMKKAEIKRKFDEIVAFAEVEKFIDTPVKHYSSGMHVRLAFAVAAHLEPEILVIDEVLAVGDAEFQKKCLGKMEDVAAKDGRTVLFVSHNMSAVQSLCGTGLLLEGGKVLCAGLIDRVATEYSLTLRERCLRYATESTALGPTLRLGRLDIRPGSISSGCPLSLDVQIIPTEPTIIRELALLIYSAWGVRVAILDLRSEGFSDILLSDGAVDFQIKIACLPLVEGDYHIGFYIATQDHKSNHLDLGSFTVLPLQLDRNAVPYPAAHRGLVELEYTLDHSLTEAAGRSFR